VRRSVLSLLSRDPRQRPSAAALLDMWTGLFEAATGTTVPVFERQQAAVATVAVRPPPQDASRARASRELWTRAKELCASVAAGVQDLAVSEALEEEQSPTGEPQPAAARSGGTSVPKLEWLRGDASTAGAGSAPHEGCSWLQTPTLVAPVHGQSTLREAVDAPCLSLPPVGTSTCPRSAGPKSLSSAAGGASSAERSPAIPESLRNVSSRTAGAKMLRTRGSRFRVRPQPAQLDSQRHRAQDIQLSFHANPGSDALWASM
jgi:hypothetical protein